jgi:hypothetical protein
VIRFAVNLYSAAAMELTHFSKYRSEYRLRSGVRRGLLL